MSEFKFHRWKWVSISTALLMLVGGGMAWRIKQNESTSRNVEKYTVAAESGKLPGLINASGELKAEKSVNVSPEKQGLLEKLFVEEGDRVKKGQVLAKMDGGDFPFRLNELKVDFEKQKSSYERRKNLFVQGAISAEEHDKYRNLYLMSKARFQQRQEEGKELLIRAPFSGVITARYAEPGAFVAPTTRASSIAGSTSTSILELSKGLEVSAKVPESEISRIRIGQEAAIRVDAFPEKRFQANVIEIAPRAAKSDNVISFEVKLALVNSPEVLRIGMTADVNFKTGESDLSTLVPTVAIVTKDGTPGVLLVDQNQSPIFQKVELGTSSGSKTSILKGVEPGNLIFIDLPPWAKRTRN